MEKKSPMKETMVNPTHHKHTTPSPPPPGKKPNKAYTGISICPQTSQCAYKPVQGFFAVQTLCPRPAPYSSKY